MINESIFSILLLCYSYIEPYVGPCDELNYSSCCIRRTCDEFKYMFIQLIALKGQCQLQCIARSNNAWRPFYWQSNSCLGFQSVIYFNHPMVILAHFNRIVTTKHQRNVYNRYLLTFHHFQGKM